MTIPAPALIALPGPSSPAREGSPMRRRIPDGRAHVFAQQDAARLAHDTQRAVELYDVDRLLYVICPEGKVRRADGRVPARCPSCWAVLR